MYFDISLPNNIILIISQDMMKNTPDSHPDAAVFAKLSKKLRKFLRNINRSSQAKIVPVDKVSYNLL